MLYVKHIRPLLKLVSGSPVEQDLLIHYELFVKVVKSLKRWIDYLGLF